MIKKIIQSKWCTMQLPWFYCWAQHHMVWDIPLGSLGQLFWPCPLPAPGAPPASSLAGQHQEQERPWLCVSTALQQLKHPPVISIVLILNPKLFTIPTARKNINSIPAKTSWTGTFILLIRLHWKSSASTNEWKGWENNHTQGKGRDCSIWIKLT